MLVFNNDHLNTPLSPDCAEEPGGEMIIGYEMPGSGGGTLSVWDY